MRGKKRTQYHAIFFYTQYNWKENGGEQKEIDRGCEYHFKPAI